MPMVRNMIKEISNKEPSTEVNPDQCVAIGAAYEAKYRYIQNEVEKILLKDGENEANKAKRMLLGSLPDISVKENVAKSLGIITLPDKDGKEIVEMIPEQSEIPISIEKNFEYAYDDQTSILAEITEGVGNKREEVSKVGHLLVENLPPRPKGAPIKVKLTYNRDKTLDIEVVDVETNQKGEGKIVLAGSMNNEEKNRVIKKFERLKQE